MDDFENKLEELGYAGVTSISMGAVATSKIEGEISFKKLYSLADKVLYEAKLAGKRRFIIK